MKQSDFYQSWCLGAIAFLAINLSASAAAAQSGFDYLVGKKFGCQLEAAHTEHIFIEFDNINGNSFEGKMGVAVWVDNKPYSQIYRVIGSATQLSSSSFQISINQHIKQMADEPPQGYRWDYRTLDEFIFRPNDGNKLTGRHTTTSPAASAYQSGIRSTYDSVCARFIPK